MVFLPWRETRSGLIFTSGSAADGLKELLAAGGRPGTSHSAHRCSRAAPTRPRAHTTPPPGPPGPPGAPRAPRHHQHNPGLLNKQGLYYQIKTFIVTGYEMTYFISCFSSNCIVLYSFLFLFGCRTESKGKMRHVGVTGSAHLPKNLFTPAPSRVSLCQL